MLGTFNILYVEKERSFQEKIVEALEFMSMQVTLVNSGTQAYSYYQENRPDIIITNIDLPDLKGLELVQKIRHCDKKIQIIVLTECTDIQHCLKAMELNLVKYLLQPVSLKALKEALIICQKNISYLEQNGSKYFNEHDYYNLKEKCLYVNKKVVRLDYHERDFLELLLKNHQRIVTYEEFDKKIWNNNMSSAALRSLVRNLRKKLPENCIANISKIGYQIKINKNLS